MIDIVILTDSRYINPKKRDWYIEQVLTEDKILEDKFKDQGLKVLKKDWADTNFDWKSTKSVIFRTTWDYFEKFDLFSNWIKSTRSKTKFINSYNTIIWNIDKHYLKDLSDLGINIPKTIFINKNQKTTLESLFKKTKFKEAIIKPTISGAARETYRINNKNHHQFEHIFSNLVSNEDMIFQEFLNNIIDNGEISLIIIGGKYTHAVKKIAKKGDFRVQDDHGGKVIEYQPSLEEIKFAEKCIEICPYKCIYARVDIIYDNNNEISISELELIEPELWFRNNQESAIKLATEVKKLLLR